MAQEKELEGRALRMSERVKNLRALLHGGETTLLIKVGRLDLGLSHLGASALAIAVLDCFTRSADRYSFGLTVLGCGMLLWTLVNRVTVIIFELQKLNLLIWDVVTDANSDYEMHTNDTRARLRGFLGLDPDR